MVVQVEKRHVCHCHTHVWLGNIQYDVVVLLGTAVVESMCFVLASSSYCWCFCEDGVESDWAHVSVFFLSDTVSLEMVDQYICISAMTTVVNSWRSAILDFT